LAERLIEVESEYAVAGQQMIHRDVPGALGSSDDDLKRYWFVMTPDGWSKREDHLHELDAYRSAHPLEPAQ
jgi:hypothetical protein